MATALAVDVAAVVIFEIAGPLLMRRALFLTGEATTVPTPLDPSTSVEPA